VEWFIIPKIAAGGETPQGSRYAVGCELAGSIYGDEIPDDVLLVIPDTITVKPEPQLDITYFQPRDVQGDDPFTIQVESPIPFIVGVLVKNSGFGPARKLKIASQQPRIVENRNGLILVAQLLGSSVDDEPTEEGDLTVVLGDIDPGRAKKGAWDMITSLSGEFIEFTASYTHDSELGGEETSVITSLNAYFINAEVLVDTPGQDDLKDFLADTDDDPAHIPDAIYTTDADVLPVNHLANAEVESLAARGHLAALVSVNAVFEDWVYIRVDDPQQARLPIESVVRSDGKVLNENNYWTNFRFDPLTNARLNYLNIFDHVALGEYTYTVTYGHLVDVDPPVTTVRFSGEAQEQGGTYYLLPETRIFFTVEDQSPVSTEYSLDGGNFVPAIPFTLSQLGEHLIQYRSVDASGNAEATQAVTVVISGGRPGVDRFELEHDRIFVSGDALSIRPDSFRFQFQGRERGPGLTAELDIFAGVLGFAAIAGVPASPTAADVATIMVGGQQVDHYKYRLGGGAWSEERSATMPIELSDLADGTHTVEVIGRSAHGDYHDDLAASASWTVAPEAAPVTISGTPLSITREQGAALIIGGGATHYRYRLNDGFFHAERPVSEPLVLQDLVDGTHVVDVVGRIDGVWQDEEAPTSVTWTVDSGYGLDFSAFELVRHEDFGAVGEALTSFGWDARTDGGAIAPPGWYSARLTLTDDLDQSNAAVRIIQVGEMMADRELTAQAEVGVERRPHAAGGWVVWQDQRDGNWDVYARAVACAEQHGNEIAVTRSDQNQEYPKTDGRWVVWQSRQEDGNWDIWAYDLTTGGAPIVITTTTGTDETRPAVYLPWIVYQRRAVDSTAPWQLVAYNVDTEETTDVDPSAADQIDPMLFKNRLVWQDWRNAGPGEVYHKNLSSGDVTRITDSPDGQYHPVIYGHWIVWSDTRHTQNELYGRDLLRDVEVRLTDTPENETRPFVLDNWVVYEEDSSGVPTTNLRILNLSNRASVQLTNNVSEKRRPVMTSGRLVWEDTADGMTRVVGGALPNLQPVYDNRSPVVVTEDMVEFQQDAFSLLALWHEQAGVTEITHYTSLEPLVAETARWDGEAIGDNFSLTAGSFLWIRFRDGRVVDVGSGGTDPIDLTEGTNIISACFFPDRFTAYGLIRDLGMENINSVRLLDSVTGRWRAAAVVNSRIVGENFPVPRVAVIMLGMNQAVPQWVPTQFSN
jgi:beta propeller repeat protein